MGIGDRSVMKTVALGHLPPGTDFLVPGFNVRGRVVYVNECRAFIYLYADSDLVDYGLHHGYTSWTPSATVKPLNGPALAPVPPVQPLKPKTRPVAPASTRYRNTGGPSAREIVFEMLNENPDLTAKEVFKELEGSISLTTARMYLYKFRNNKEMPGYAGGDSQ